MRALNKAPQGPVARTSTVAMFGGKLQAALLLLGDFVALRILTVFSKYERRTPRRFRMPFVARGLGSLALRSAYRRVRVGSTRMNCGQNCVRAIVSNYFFKGRVRTRDRPTHVFAEPNRTMLFTEQKKNAPNRTLCRTEQKKNRPNRTFRKGRRTEPNRTNSILGATAKTRKPKGGVPRQRFCWSELPTRKTISRKKIAPLSGPQQKSSAFSLRKIFGSLSELDIIHVLCSSFLTSGFPPETELNPFVLPGWDRIRSRIEKSQNE